MTSSAFGISPKWGRSRGGKRVGGDQEGVKKSNKKYPIIKIIRVL